MAEALVKFFMQRLETLLLQEAETFTCLTDQILSIKDSLKKIGEFLGDKDNAESDAALCSWVNKVKDIVFAMDDHIDEFMIQMAKKIGADRLALTECFRHELQKIEFQIAETVCRITELNISTVREEKKGEKEGQASSASSTVPFKLEYNSLPYYLQSCLMYCCIFPENYWIHKGRLIRWLVAEGLIQEKTGQLLEEVAEENINELVNRGMLQVIDRHPGDGIKLIVSSPYRIFLGENFTITQADLDASNVKIPRTARCVLTSDMSKIGQNNLQPRSLFLFGNQENIEGNWVDLKWAKFLRVLDLENTKMKRLPDEVGDLIHLTYLGLKHCNLNELPATLGKLRALQTLDIRWCGNLSELSPEILRLVSLRHLKMFKSINVSGVELPQGMGRLRNLLTLTGVHAGGGIAGELDKLTLLRRLGVMDVAEENAGELYASIMKMKGLFCLSLEATFFNKQHLVLSESFTPPPLLRKLRLEGLLEKIPSWLGSMENLTKLRLGFSHLSENPTSVLQLLPNLRILTLWQAYDAKQLGKEFCKAGGFPKLEILSIASHVLEEWTELEEGALPSLQYLHFHNCLSLRMLPEGLQSVTTLKQLDLLPLLDEHAERLKPDGGEENYKIGHIPRISFLPMSVLNSMAHDHPCNQTEVKSEE
ncbi:hypothetical protein JCGZ_11423 [Jatropha curcas]|uniref:Uncharacterized protein n=1 Tax=Jatropha curcas TaxID=180498 RepID=A0A067K4I7_JATCU|nr:disease resistance protein RPM1 [Jatropha curcas]KDP31047.1 hypothetical protein JCGZ_11423 [Jatropha curcas]